MKLGSKPSIMNKDFILKSDILDIIFENRNKEYGAYNLRKFYPGRIKIAIGAMLVIAIAFSVATLLPPQNKLIKTRQYIFTETILTKIPDVPKQQKKQPDTKQKETIQQANTTPVRQQKFINNIKVVDNIEKTEVVKSLPPDSKIGSEIIETPASIPAVIKAKTDNPGDGKMINVSSINNSIPMDADAVDVLPSYPGGMDALIKFLQKHLQTPDEIREGEIVNVRIRFVVGYNGKLQGFVTLLDGGSAYNNEVVRVLKRMPDWVPGKSNGENVSVYYTIPVKFESVN